VSTHSSYSTPRYSTPRGLSLGKENYWTVATEMRLSTDHVLGPVVLTENRDGSLSAGAETHNSYSHYIHRKDQPTNPALHMWRDYGGMNEPGKRRRYFIGEATERSLPELVEALNARNAALRSEDPWVDQFGSGVLVVAQSERWREAVSTALLGDWALPLAREGHLTVEALSNLRAEARAIHRQLVPLWRRRTRHSRVVSLDAPMGDDISLYDVVAAERGLLDPSEMLAGLAIDDPRLRALLRVLREDELKMVITRALDGLTWTEAAQAAAASDPINDGERVRRKVKRLVDEQNRRREQSSGRWLPAKRRGRQP